MHIKYLLISLGWCLLWHMTTWLKCSWTCSIILHQLDNQSSVLQKPFHPIMMIYAEKMIESASNVQIINWISHTTHALTIIQWNFPVVYCIQNTIVCLRQNHQFCLQVFQYKLYNWFKFHTIGNSFHKSSPHWI